MRSLLLAFLSALPCACNRADQAVVEAPLRDSKDQPADDGDFLEPVEIPGGIADDQGKVGYLANTKRGIDAVDLESGKVLWHAASAAHPLLVYKNRLYAQESLEAGRIVALDVGNTGKQVWASDPIQIGATPQRLKEIEEKHGLKPDARLDLKSATCRARIQQGQLHLIWRSLGEFTARIDLASGKVAKLPWTPAVRRNASADKYSEIAKIAGDPKAFGLTQKLPAIAKLEDPQPRELFKEESMILRSRWVAGNVLAVLLWSSERDEKRFSARTILVLWDTKTGKNLHSNQVLHESRYSDGFVGRAFQGRYIARSVWERERNFTPSAPLALFSLESRKWSPPVSLENSASGITVVGSRLLYVRTSGVPGTEILLKAVNLPELNRELPPTTGPSMSGVVKPPVLWERPILLPLNSWAQWEQDEK